MKSYEDFIRDLEKSGAPLARYECPDCGGEIKARIPDDPEDMWDSMSLCPHCPGRHFRAVYGNGTVEVRTEEDAA